MKLKKERSMNTDEVYKNLLERMRNKPPKSDPTRLVKGDDFKIVGGQDVTNHTWPFLVNIGNFCMGSIIGKCAHFDKALIRHFDKALIGLGEFSGRFLNWLLVAMS